MSKKKNADRYGRKFDAKLHAVDADGKPEHTSSGYLRIKKKGSSGESSSNEPSKNNSGRKTFKDVAGNTCYRDKIDGTIRLA